jgi:hypothetical protein
LGVEEVRLKATAEDGKRFESSLQVTYIKDCRTQFVDLPMISINQRQSKITLSVEELKFALDLENCPVEGMSLVEEQPTESIDAGTSQEQFDIDLDLVEVE